SMTWSILMIRCIDALLEGGDANAAEGVEKLFILGTLLHVDANDLFDDVGHVLLGEGWAEDLSDVGFAAGAATQGHLVELGTFLVHPENADMADVVVPAGIHAAGNVQVQLADVEQVIEVVEAALDGFGNRDRLGVGQRAEITARAAD